MAKIDVVHIGLKEDDWFDIHINNELEIHIKRNDIGYSVDLYKLKTSKFSDDDFISAAIALDEDLK